MDVDTHIILKPSVNYRERGNKVDVPKPKKYEKYFNYDKVLINKYLFKPFPDKQFAKQLLNCLEYDEKTGFKNITKIYNHVMKEMGGFKIDGWKIKSLPV